MSFVFRLFTVYGLNVNKNFMFILQKKIKKFKKESFSSLKPEKLEIYYRIVISNSNGYKSKAVRQLFPNK